MSGFFGVSGLRGILDAGGIRLLLPIVISLATFGLQIAVGIWDSLGLLGLGDFGLGLLGRELAGVIIGVCIGLGGALRVGIL